MTTKVAKTDDIKKSLEEANPIEPGMNLNSLLNSDTIRSRFSDVLGDKAAGFISSILSATSTNPTLLTCDPMSVISAAMIAATLDLEINPSLGFAHIVPYKGKATFQIGWKGIYQLAMRTGEYRTISISTVYEGEIKNHNKFTGHMEFVVDGKTSNTVAGYLLYFRLLNGFEKYVYMTHDNMEKHAKRYSQSYKKGGGVWKDNFEAMAHKTVVKNGLGKFGILSVKMKKAFASDQAVIDNDGKPQYVDTDATPDVSFEPATDPKNKEDEQL